MKQDKKEKSILALCAPVLLLMLAAGILTVLLGSAAIYQRQNSRVQASGDRRTAALYLTNKLRQAPGAVTVQPFGQGTALVLPEQADGTAYVTRIYCFDGWLMELFAPEAGDFSPTDGEKILPMAALEMNLEDGLLRIEITDTYGNRDALTIVPMQGGEVQP